MFYTLFEPTTGYNLAGGNTTTSNLPTGEKGAESYPLLDFVMTSYGADANNGKVYLQGSINGLNWFTVDSKTLTQATAIGIGTFVTTHVIVVSGDKRTNFINGNSFYIDGSTTNDGRYTVTQTNYKGQLDYSNISSGSFTVGHTIIGSVSHASATIAADDGTTLTLTDVVGTFSASDVITEQYTLKTADVDTVASVTTVVVSEALTVEVAAGNIWVADSVNLSITSSYFLYYRLYVEVNSVTTGYLDISGVGKRY